MDAAGEPGHRGARRRGGAQREHGASEGPGAGERLPQARRDTVDGQLVRVPGMNGEGHRGDQAVQHAGSHPPAHQFPECLAGLSPAERDEHVPFCAQRRAQPGDGDHVLGQRRSGDAEQAGLRQRNGVAVRRLQPRTGRVRGDDVVAESEFGDQGSNGAAARGEALGTGIQVDAGDRVAGDASAECRGCLKQRDLEAADREVPAATSPAMPPPTTITRGMGIRSTRGAALDARVAHICPLFREE